MKFSSSAVVLVGKYLLAWIVAAVVVLVAKTCKIGIIRIQKRPQDMSMSEIRKHVLSN